MSRILAALLVSLMTLSSSHAASIRVRQECGFSFAVCGEVVTLEQNGASHPYQGVGSTGPLPFSLAYQDDEFVMTALTDGLRGGSLPFGLAVYPGSGPMLTLAWQADSTAYGFLSMNQFPEGEGATRTVAIPPQVREVSEPQAGLLLAGGLAVLGLRRKLRA